MSSTSIELAKHVLLVFGIILAQPATIAYADPATPVPGFRQVKVKDRVAQTITWESALKSGTNVAWEPGVANGGL